MQTLLGGFSEMLHSHGLPGCRQAPWQALTAHGTVLGHLLGVIKPSHAARLHAADKERAHQDHCPICP